MKKILYIHGYNSRPETSSTRRHLQQLLGEGYEVAGVEYTQESPLEGLRQIETAVAAEKPDLVVGSSLGGFFTLCLGCSVLKVVINPCLYPSVELPRLGYDHLVRPYEALETEKIRSVKDSEDYETTVGIFGDHDELFSYKDAFRKIYRGSKTKTISAGHQLTLDDLKQVAPEMEMLMNKDLRAKFDALHL